MEYTWKKPVQQRAGFLGYNRHDVQTTSELLKVDIEINVRGRVVSC